MLELVQHDPMSVALVCHALSAVTQGFHPLPEMPFAWIYGEPGTGKTARARLMASTAGTPERTVLPFSAVLDGPQALVRSRSGSVVILDDLRLAMGFKKQGARAGSVADVVALLSSGRAADPYDGAQLEPVALSSAMVGNEMLGDHFTGLSYSEQASLLDRTMTFSANVFSLEPSLASPLDRLTKANHGCIMSNFARRMLRMFHNDRKRLAGGIERRQEEFRTLVQANTCMTGDERIVDHFGRLFVNGALAVHWGLFPEAFADPNIALQCLDAHRGLLSPLSPIEQIHALADDPNIIDLSAYRREPFSQEQLDALLFVRDHDGYRELVMTRACSLRASPTQR